MDLKKIKEEKTTEELLSFGILNIDKPADWTSFDVVNHIRKSLGLPKAGHLGTLDPLVTGVLPICLDKTCRIQEYLMHQDKTYIGVMKIHKNIELEKLKSEMKNFIGKINQLPPRKSRVKRQIRQREIMNFEITDFNENTREANFIARVEAGTYIRKLISDLGEKIGGAHMASLRRIKAGLFSSEDKEFVSIQEFNDAVLDYESGNDKKLRKILIPAEIITQLIPIIEVKEEFIGKLKNGSPFFDEMPLDFKKAKKIIETKQPFAVVGGNKFIEIAKFTDKFEQKSILAKALAVIH
jgi:H/ACA ribonucleoprotein complex subunit 4